MSSGRPLRTIVEAIVSRELSPAARQSVIADFARKRLAEGLAQNERATGRIVPYQQVVDGRQGAALESVDPDRGRILFLFHVASNELFVWIADMLVRHAPRLTGRYADSFRLFAGGRQIEVGEALPKADEYAFLNVQPYAGRLERGWSGQAPDGVLQAVAALAKVRYADVAQVRFTYRHFSEFGLAPKPTTRAEKASNRTPAIMVSLR